MNGYSLPAMEKLEKALARDFVDAFEKGQLKAVYARASAVAPKLYPAREQLNATDTEKVTELLADSFLLLGKKR